MKGCITPGEILSNQDQALSVFGSIAEDIIYADFRAKYGYSYGEVYKDDYNPAAYLYFLSRHNPNLNLMQYASGLSSLELGINRPDILIHSIGDRSFYEIKPDSATGTIAGVEKVLILAATFARFNLHYRPGTFYTGCSIRVAYLAGQIAVTLNAELKEQGLITYKLCLECNHVLELAVIAAILRYVIQQMNKQAKGKSFTPVDLTPAFAREGQLSMFATTLGLAAMTVVASVGWKYFWKAVIKRFAVRGATALALAAADGPLPVGDLIAAGMAILTIVDVIRFSRPLWDEAAKIKAQEA